jgi:hypothetical protein
MQLITSPAKIVRLIFWPIRPKPKIQPKPNPINLGI